MKRFIITVLFLLFIGAVAFVTREILLTKIDSGPQGAGHIVVKAYEFDSPSVVAGWEEKALARKKTKYTVTDYKGMKCVKAVSEASCSAFYCKEQLSWQKWPYISWDWIVEKFPEHEEKESLDDKQEFDFPAQIYVVFYSRFFLQTKAIQYVWARDVPKGAVADNPYTKNIKVMVLESGLSEEWKHEERNIKDDFKLLFGEDLSKDVVGAGFMSDSDSTKSGCIGYYANLTFGYFEEEPKAGEEKKETKQVTFLNKAIAYLNKIKERSSHQIPK